MNKLDYSDYLEGTWKVLQQSQAEKELYTTLVAGKEFLVYPNVFSPKYFNDTELFAMNLPLRDNEQMLEIGPGTGAVSIISLYRGAGKITAIDINPDAVKNTQANIELHNMCKKMEVREGNLYSPLHSNEKFDTIFRNTPFGFIENTDISDLERAVYDPGYVSTERFIKEAKNHLNANGRVLVGFSTTLGKVDLLKKFTEEANLSLKLIYEAESEEIHPVKFEIFESESLT